MEKEGWDREHVASELLRQCEDIQAESEIWENKRAQRRREQASTWLQASAKGWNEIMVAGVTPEHLQLGPMLARKGKLRWQLDPCENPVRQRRKMTPFPEFVSHTPRHVWDAGQDAAQGRASDAGNGRDSASDGSESRAGDQTPSAPASADVSCLPEGLVHLDKDVINQLLKQSSSCPSASAHFSDEPLEEAEIGTELIPEADDVDTKEEDDEEEDEACDEKEVLYDEQDWVHVEADGDVLHSWPCELVTPAAVCAGSFEVTRRCLSFIPDAARSELRKTPRDDAAALSLLLAEKRSWAADDLMQMHGRRYLLRDTALEFFFASDPPVFLNFPIPQTDPPAEEEEGDETGNSSALRVGSLLQLSHGAGPASGAVRTGTSEVGAVYKAVLARKMTNLTIHYLRAPRAFDFSCAQDDWVQRRISTFEYLMLLNSYAGRSFNDLTQYPVFPWVLKDFTSPVLRLDNPDSYRGIASYEPAGLRAAAFPAVLHSFQPRPSCCIGVGDARRCASLISLCVRACVRAFA